MFKFFRSKRSTSTDEALLKRFQAEGDLEVLTTLFERYMELVYGVCLKYLSDPSQAEDAVMEIFEELTQKVHKHEIDKFRPWLYVLTKNHCLMKIRSEKKEKSDSVDPHFMYSEEKWHPTTGEHTDQLPIEQLNNCIKTLPEQQQDCIQKFYLEGMSYKEISELLQIELGKVRSNIQNGRRNLKICMEEKALKNESE